MTSNAPESVNSLEQDPKPNKKRRILVGVTVAFFLALSGGLSYGRYYLYQKLSPRVEQQLSKTLNRPINIGALQSFSLRGIRVGYSELPATKEYNDHVVLESIIVNYSLWALLTQRHLNLDLTVINPQVYIEQDSDRQWVAFKFTPPKPKKGDITVNLGTVRVRRGQVTMVSRRESSTLQAPIELALNSGQARFSEKNQVIRFEAKGDLAKGGKLEVSGGTDIRDRTIELNLRTKKAAIAVVTDFLSMPLTLVDGVMDGAVGMYFQNGNLLSWKGGVVTQGVTVQLPQLSKPIVGVSSKISFQNKQLQLNELVGQLGAIVLSGKLGIDLEKGLDGKLVTAPVEISKVLKTFDLQAPEFTLTGKVKGLVSLSGALTDPQLVVDAVNDQALKFDRLTIKDFQGTLAVVGSQFVLDNLRAIPTLGGELTGQGIVQLPTKKDRKGAIAVAIKGNQLPTNALAQLYEVSLPVTLGLGKTEVIFEAALDKIDQFLVSGRAVVPVAGGIVTATDLKVTKNTWQTPAKAEGLRLAQLTTQALPSFLQRSLVNGEFVARGLLNQDTKKQPKTKKADDSLEVTGQARTTVAGGQAIARNLKIKKGQWLADIALAGLDLRQLSPDLPSGMTGRYGGNFRAAGNIDNISTDTVEVAGAGRLTLGDGGVIRTEKVTVSKGAWYSRAEMENMNFVTFAPQLAAYDKTVSGEGSFEVKGTIANPELENIVAQGSALARFAGGTIQGGLITLQKGQLNGEFIAQNIDLKSLSGDLKGVTNGKIQLVADVLQPDLKRMQAQGELAFSRGISLIDSPLQSSWAWNGKQLQIKQAIAQNFRADGVIDINSDRLDQNPQAAIGKIALNVAAQNINLAKLSLPENAQDLDLKGTGDFSGTVQGTLQQPSINGKIALNNAQIVDLRLEPSLTGAIQTRGDRRTIIALEGGTDKIIARLNSHLRPEQVSLNLDNTALELALNYNKSGLDPTTLQLNTQNLPVALAHRLAQTQKAIQQIDFPIAAMQLGGSLSAELNANLQNKSASGRVTIDAPLVGYIQGDRLSGEFYFGNKSLMLQQMQWQQNGGTYTVDSTITLPDQPYGQPSVQTAGKIDNGRIEDVLAAMQLFDYEDFKTIANLSLPDYFGRSSKFENVMALYAEPAFKSLPSTTSIESLGIPVVPTVDPKEETRAQYNCDDLLNEQFQGNDIRSKILASRGHPDQSFVEKIALLGCVQKQLNIDVATNKPFLPAELADLSGEFSGDIGFTYNEKEGVQADFDLSGGYREIEEFGAKKIVGAPWQWGKIEMPQVIAKGVLRDNVLTFRPIGIRLSEDDGGGRISFIGSFGGQTQTGQLGLTAVPTAFLQKFVDLPEAIGVEGLINATAALSGTTEDPSARGDLTVANARINDTPIAAVTGNFTYENARLNFIVDSELVAGADPLKITGSIPYQLPNATVAPASDDLKLTFNLQDEGFILLNILSQGQLAWLNGEGNVDLSIDGTINPKNGRLTDLVAKGQAAIAKAAIQVQALPDAPLTNVHGKIDFDFDNLTVNEFTGDFSGGNIIVSGKLPIARVTAEPQTLSVLLNNLNFELPKLYRGGVDGNLIVAGTSLKPKVSGDIKLYEGRIFLTDQEEPSDLVSSNPTSTAPKKPLKQNATASSKSAGGLDLIDVTEFKDLRITLGQNIQITRQPILNFLATGDLILNGTLNDPYPSGVITLQRGQVNLFATQFRLDGGYKNKATFIPLFGLDPELDVVLQTSLVENPKSLLGTTSPLSAEIEDTTVFKVGQIGSIETIRVQAKVRGKASELDDNLELSSSPSRSEGELVSLLGGTLLENFYTDNTGQTLALANLAGSALFNTIQDAIGDALGLSELRLFPTVITNEQERQSTLGLGAELSMNLSPSFSFSLLQILNSNESTQFGLRYRVNDEIFMRGSTDLGNDSRLTVEYNLRF